MGCIQDTVAAVGTWECFVLKVFFKAQYIDLCSMESVCIYPSHIETKNI